MRRFAVSMDTSPPTPTQISAVLLAAGSARRMGGEKVLLSLDGEPMLRRVAREVVALGLSEILVVANARNHAAVFATLSDLPVRVLVNPRASEGIGTSIGLAAASVAPTSQAMLLAQGDQPLVERGMLRALVRTWREESPDFVASSYDEIITTPVLFSCRLLDELRELGGDRGARFVLERRFDRGRVLAFPAWRGIDVDTPDDYERVRHLAASVRRH
jgi:molybdenum cofactor cytidylyltransferase